MRPRSAIVFVSWMLMAAALAGPLTSPAAGQGYSATVDFAIQESFLVGQQITVLGTFTTLASRDTADVVTVSLEAPDQIPVLREFFVAQGTAAGTTFTFGDDPQNPITQATFQEGAFTLTIRSQSEGIILQRTYPVPNLSISVRVVPPAGGVGSDFVVETTIDIGQMAIIVSRFDVRYALQGQVLSRSEIVTLANPTLLAELGLPTSQDFQQWHVLQPFSLGPGEHTLTVTVVDQSVGAQVLSQSFSLHVTDRVTEVESGLEETDARLDGLQRTSAIATPLAYLSLVAIAMSTVALLIQFGILKLRRVPKEPPEPREPLQ